MRFQLFLTSYETKLVSTLSMYLCRVSPLLSLGPGLVRLVLTDLSGGLGAEVELL